MVYYNQGSEDTLDCESQKYTLLCMSVHIYIFSTKLSLKKLCSHLSQEINYYFLFHVIFKIQLVPTALISEPMNRSHVISKNAYYSYQIIPRLIFTLQGSTTVFLHRKYFDTGKTAVELNFSKSQVLLTGGDPFGVNKHLILIKLILSS